MGDINVCVFSGNIGKDCVVRPFNNGKGAVSFSLAVTESWTDSNKVRQETTDWLECERIGSEAFMAYARQYYVKGQTVVIKAKAKTKEWVSDGVTHRKVVFALEDIQLKGDIKGRAQGQAQQPQAQSQPHAQPAQQQPQQAAQRPYGAAAPGVPSFSYADEEDIGF